jgi:hypothetical protein
MTCFIDFNVLSGQYNSHEPKALWVPRGDPSPPLFFVKGSHHEARDAINAFYQPLGFACTIDNINRHNPSKQDAGKYVTSFTLRCACGRDYKH